MSKFRHNLLLILLIHKYLIVSAFLIPSICRFEVSTKLSASYVNNRNHRRTNPPPDTNAYRRVRDPHDPDSYPNRGRASNPININGRRRDSQHNINRERRNHTPNNTDQSQRDEFITNRIEVDSPTNFQRRMDPPNIHQRRMKTPTSYQRRPDAPNYNQRMDPSNMNGRRIDPPQPPPTEQRQKDQSNISNNRNIMDPSTSTKEELLQFYDLKEILIRTNPYEILQVSPSNNDKDELKQAYRKLALKFHPDAVVGNDNKILANDAFAKINEAYNTLLNDCRSTPTSVNGDNVDTSTYQYYGQQEAAKVGQYEEEYFYPRGEDWYRKHKEHERAVCNDFDPAEYEVTSNSVGSIFTEMIEYVNE